MISYFSFSAFNPLMIKPMNHSENHSLNYLTFSTCESSSVIHHHCKGSTTILNCNNVIKIHFLKEKMSAVLLRNCLLGKATENDAGHRGSLNFQISPEQPHRQDSVLLFKALR